MKSTQTGLTLIELMVTLAVAIVLLAVGIPLFSGIVGSNRATSDANALVAAMQLARSEAVKRGSFVAVVSLDSVWDQGWRVYLENDRPVDSTFGSQGAGDTTLRDWPSIRDSVDTSAPWIVTNPTAGYFAFSPTGLFVSDVSSSATVGLEYSPLDSSSNRRRCVVVTPVGQARVKVEEPGETWSCP